MNLYLLSSTIYINKIEAITEPERNSASQKWSSYADTVRFGYEVILLLETPYVHSHCFLFQNGEEVKQECKRNYQEEVTISMYVLKRVIDRCTLSQAIAWLVPFRLERPFLIMMYNFSYFSSISDDIPFY
ncbi:hypothetical protein [Fictibacillus sp. NRS-1165]|uniref:hypothetical protein n=1 Tax=Fictibacillus sp. NRS-1165 TaxID=3144463 RepID=UPI003D1B12FB